MPKSNSFLAVKIVNYHIKCAIGKLWLKHVFCISFRVNTLKCCGYFFFFVMATVRGQYILQGLIDDFCQKGLFKLCFNTTSSVSVVKKSEGVAMVIANPHHANSPHCKTYILYCYKFWNNYAISDYFCVLEWTNIIYV